MSMAWMPAKAYNGPFTSGRPLGVVIHCTEGPLTAGMAESLMGPNWFGGGAGTSIHKTADSDSIVEGVRRNVVAYHVGPAGNARYIGYEICGRVAMSKDEWRKPEALSMLRIAAAYIADDLKFCGAPPRWMSLTQIAAGERGLLTHNDVRLALGGTTHSDPGANFPYSELLAYVAAAYNGQPLEDDEMSAQFESNMTEWTRMRDARDQQLEADLRADLAWKGEQISVLSAAVAGLTQVLSSDEATDLTTEEITAAVQAGIPERLTYVLGE